MWVSLSKQSKLKPQQRGFSIVEMLVSVALFAIVVTVTSGTLVVMMNANTKAQALYSVMTNLSFAIDSMTRNIRTGYDYYCANGLNNNPLPSGDQDGTGHCSGFVFTREINGQRVGYRLHAGAIEQRVGAGLWQRITADDVTITRMQFRVNGTSDAEEQPHVLLRIEGQVTNANDEGAKFLLQTLITQQILDY